MPHRPLGVAVGQAIPFALGVARDGDAGIEVKDAHEKTLFKAL
ncbi:MAG: hypothetical protein AABZ12_07795 [Planctomycetota bacterium]